VVQVWRIARRRLTLSLRVAHTKVVGQPTHFCLVFFTADKLRYPVTFTSDPLTLHICDVVKICTKFYWSRAIHGGVIAISKFDLMTSNMRQMFHSSIIFAEFELDQLIRSSL